MPSVATALLALALHDRPVTDAGVWLSAPPLPGTRVTAPLVVSGETQAPEGVLRIELYAVRGTTVTPVASYVPTVPVGTVPFTFRWTPDGSGTVTLRVVATTLVRGFSAEAKDLVVPAVSPPAVVTRPAPARAAVARMAPPPAARRAAVAAPTVDDSGVAFGGVAPTLPYVRTAAAPVTAATVAAPVASEEERSGWVSFAGGLVVLLVCSHLHRSLRREP